MTSLRHWLQKEGQKGIKRMYFFMVDLDERIGTTIEANWWILIAWSHVCIGSVTQSAIE